MPTEIIAEIGASHGGSLDEALSLADACIRAGADVIKVQVGLRHLCEPTSEHAQQFAQSDLDYSEWDKVAAECRKMGARFSASIWHPDGAPWLKSLRAPWIKVGSGDATFEPTLAAARDSGLPVYLAVGGCTEAEIWQSKAVLGDSLACLMACTLNYPSLPSEAYLSRMNRLRKFGVRVGYSSHVPNIMAPIYAARLGASAVEVHVDFKPASAIGQGGVDLPAFKRICDDIKGLVPPIPISPQAQWEMLAPGVELGCYGDEEKWKAIARRGASGKRA